MDSSVQKYKAIAHVDLSPLLFPGVYGLHGKSDFIKIQKVIINLTALILSLTTDKQETHREPLALKKERE